MVFEIIYKYSHKKALQNNLPERLFPNNSQLYLTIRVISETTKKYFMFYKKKYNFYLCSLLPYILYFLYRLVITLLEVTKMKTGEKKLQNIEKQYHMKGVPKNEL